MEQRTELYFSRVKGKPIYDSSGQRVGKVRDMAVSWDNATPWIVGIKYEKDSHCLIPCSVIKEMSEDGIRLASPMQTSCNIQLREEETYIAKWLLDKQIIDLKGTKLVRVNDIMLSWFTTAQGQTHVALTAVDIGLKGLCRRLGIEFLVKNRADNLLGWQHINPLENRTSNLQLKREKEQLGQMHPADIADLIEDMDYNKRASFLENLDEQQAADALAEMELETQVEIIEQMDQQRASDLLEELPPDEAADILGELPEEKSREILSLMEKEEADEVQELMDYDDETAGALMTTEYIAVAPELTAQEAIDELRRMAPEAETIYYLYVTDEQEHLLGVCSLRELILTPPEKKLTDFMHKKVVTVHFEDDHSVVADKIHKYSLLALPVVDEENVLQGIITVDDVMDILMSDRSRVEIFSNLLSGKRSGRGWKQ